MTERWNASAAKKKLRYDTLSFKHGYGIRWVSFALVRAGLSGIQDISAGTSGYLIENDDPWRR